MTKTVLFEELTTKGNATIGVITLNSEKTLNALTLTMVELMLEQLKRWQHNNAIIAVLIQGTGDKAFCAGGDVQALYHCAVARQNTDNKVPTEALALKKDQAEVFFEQEYRLDYLLHNYPKPTIIWGHGIVMGGGLGLFAACSHRIATEKTRIAMPEVTIALFPDVGGSYFLNKLPGQTGRFLALTGASINAIDSYYAELSDYTISQAHKQTLLDAILAIEETDNKPAFEAQLTALCLKFQDDSAHTMPDGNLIKHQTLIDQLCRGNNVEVIADNINTLTTDDPWLQRAQSGFKKGSPLAIKWIFQQLELCKGLPLKAVFEKEIILVTNIVRHTEFVEGVRALLIDKDNNPQWQYQQLCKVDNDQLTQFFKAPWPQNPLADL